MPCCPQGLHAKQLTSGVSKGALKAAARRGERATTANGRATDDGQATSDGKVTGDGNTGGGLESVISCWSMVATKSNDLKIHGGSTGTLMAAIRRRGHTD